MRIAPNSTLQVGRKGMTFEGWKGFVAVQEDKEEDLWTLYFDRSDNGLSGGGLIGDMENRGKRVRMLAVQQIGKERPKDLETATEERIERIRKMKAQEKKEQEEGLNEEKEGKDGEET